MAPTAATLQGSDSDPYRARYSAKLQTYLENVDKYGAVIGPEKKADGASDIEHSGPQGSVKPLTIVHDPADWTAESLAGKEDTYTYVLSDKDVAEIISAVNSIKARTKPTEEAVKALSAADYNLPTFAPKVIAFAKEASTGRGFQLLRNFPVKHFEGDRFGLVLAFWGLALILGTPQTSQTDYNEKKETFASLLNHITIGRHTPIKQDMVYPENAQAIKDNAGKPARDVQRIEFHSDQGATDLIALVSVTASKEGGESKWVSAIAIHNELLRRGRKDLVEVLTTRGIWKVPRKRDQAAYARNADGSFVGFEDDPPFLYHDGYLSSHFSTGNYQELDLTPLQQEAIWAVAALAEDPKFHLKKIFQPGDIEIIHNPTIYHSRGDVIDGEEPHQKRHLLRWWVQQPKERNPRPIIPTFAPRSNVLPQGGFTYPEGSTIRLPFYPYSRHDGVGQSPTEYTVPPAGFWAED